MASDRREFLGSLLAVGAVPLVGKSVSRYVGNAARESTDLPTYRPTATSWDVSWADKLTGKHRAVFDNVEVNEGLGLLRAQLWLRDYADVYGATPAEMSGVTVLRHGAIWIAMDDEFWSHHSIGAMTKIDDPTTKQPIKRNPFFGANPFGLPPAMADDALKKVLASNTVLACNVALTFLVIEKIKTDLKLDDVKAREMALKHLVPGVILQPSGVFATLRAQEAGCQYLLATDA